jgi:hypothetical protein
MCRPVQGDGVLSGGGGGVLSEGGGGVVRLAAVAGGQTYSQVSTAGQANPSDATLAA